MFFDSFIVLSFTHHQSKEGFFLNRVLVLKLHVAFSREWLCQGVGRYQMFGNIFAAGLSIQLRHDLIAFLFL